MDGKLAQLALEPYALGAEHRQRLEEDGFTVFEGVIGDDWLHALRQAPFPGEVRLLGKAGSVGVFNCNAWHGSSAT